MSSPPSLSFNLECSICGLLFKSKEILSQHVEELHRSNSLTSSNPYGDISSWNNNALVSTSAHTSSHTSSNTSPNRRYEGNNTYYNTIK
jgi:hypothetical protein